MDNVIRCINKNKFRLFLPSNYAQMVGKVVKANAIDVFSMSAVSNNFDMQIYNTAINLSLSEKFNNLF